MNTRKIKEIIKLQLADPQWKRYKRIIGEHKEKSIFVIGSPVHGNLGDHAIIEEEKKFLKEYFPDYIHFEILMPFYHTQKRFLQKNINSKDLVCISGGGWMGNLWIHNEIVVREIVETYLFNQVIIFPQTLYYTKDTQGYKELEKTVQVFAKHKNLIFCVRDRNSYELILNRFELNGKSKVVYCPDMVLYGHCEKNFSVAETNSNINICIRDDCEGVYKNTRENIMQFIPAQYQPVLIDTVVPHRVSLKTRKYELNKIWGEFATAKLTITDRLHAMLFSVINGTPCIALNNKTGKVFGVYEWIAELRLVICVDSVEEIKERLFDMLLVHHRKYDTNYLQIEFDRLATIIREAIEENGNQKIISNKCSD